MSEWLTSKKIVGPTFFTSLYFQAAQVADAAEGGEAEKGRQQGGQGRKLASLRLLQSIPSGDADADDDGDDDDDDDDED